MRAPRPQPIKPPPGYVPASLVEAAFQQGVTSERNRARSAPQADAGSRAVSGRRPSAPGRRPAPSPASSKPKPKPKPKAQPQPPGVAITFTGGKMNGLRGWLTDERR